MSFAWETSAGQCRWCGKATSGLDWCRQCSKARRRAYEQNNKKLGSKFMPVARAAEKPTKARLRLAEAIEDFNEARAKLDEARAARGNVDGKIKAQLRVIASIEEGMENLGTAHTDFLVAQELGKAKGPAPASEADLKAKLSQAESELKHLKAASARIQSEGEEERQRRLRFVQVRLQEAKAEVLRDDPDVQALIKRFAECRQWLANARPFIEALDFAGALPKELPNYWRDIVCDPKLKVDHLKMSLADLDNNAEGEVGDRAGGAPMTIPAPLGFLEGAGCSAWSRRRPGLSLDALSGTASSTGSASLYSSSALPASMLPGSLARRSALRAARRKECNSMGARKLGRLRSPSNIHLRQPGPSLQLLAFSLSQGGGGFGTPPPSDC